MSLLIVSPGKDPKPWVKALQNQHPGLNIYVYPEEHDKKEVDFVLAWKHPRGLFKNYPNLKVIASMGAGVDHITSDSELPENIQITKVVDNMLEEDMGNFVLSLILNYQRNLLIYQKQQAEKTWNPVTYKRNKDVNVGVLGLGHLGQTTAKTLAKNGFKVHGFSKTPKNIENIESFSGEDEMEAFLEKSEILVNLLPLTPETKNILNKGLFEKLPEGAYVINVARGEHLVELDLIEMLDKDHLSGAAMDVFRQEPLPEDHPFWEHPKVFITPHIASVTHPNYVVPQIVENYERMKEDEPLKNVVEREKGY
ncbi:2-hydroxyacid dehydrogenase [Salegentibacter flavus]|uniref:Glyoxylate/hydroxypyruvate reductase A n=1 Tax=Salegentibacter flavus TaxID=287099 RepID=A0A1I4YX53_9FLAO|nr:glyoxylate/hydroxypyruvate reductase A [Salegentibacter flavus]SFN42582.1 glyoxylate/hydroxypyruvate reductase A [Salegentibacter flavus]